MTGHYYATQVFISSFYAPPPAYVPDPKGDAKVATSDANRPPGGAVPSS